MIQRACEFQRQSFFADVLYTKAADSKGIQHNQAKINKIGT